MKVILRPFRRQCIDHMALQYKMLDHVDFHFCDYVYINYSI